MAKTLLVIDYSKDFVADDGALTCGKPAQAIDQRITELCKQFLQNKDWVIFPMDAHLKNDPYHPETKLYPPHNIIGTAGREVYGQTGKWYLENKNNDHVLLMDKNRYSAFQNTNLDNYLHERHIHDLTLTGVCTDICVLHTAIAAYNLDYEITIPRSAVATFTSNGDEWAMAHFKNALGANIAD